MTLDEIATRMRTAREIIRDPETDAAGREEAARGLHGLRCVAVDLRRYRATQRAKRVAEAQECPECIVRQVDVDCWETITCATCRYDESAADERRHEARGARMER